MFYSALSNPIIDVPFHLLRDNFGRMDCELWKKGAGVSIDYRDTLRLRPCQLSAICHLSCPVILEVLGSRIISLFCLHPFLCLQFNYSPTLSWSGAGTPLFDLALNGSSSIQVRCLITARDRLSIEHWLKFTPKDFINVKQLSGQTIITVKVGISYCIRFTIHSVTLTQDRIFM